MNDNIDNLQTDAQLHMKKCILIFQEHIRKVHIGRVSPDMLDGICAEYYGILTPLSQLTNAIAENTRVLTITVFDKKIVKSVEKALLTSDLGLYPVVSENIIRITLPILTEERRCYLKKMVHLEAEKSKISIRNIRRHVNDKVKNLFRNKEINIDEEHDFYNRIQKITDFWIKKIDVILMQKEAELMVL